MNHCHRRPTNLSVLVIISLLLFGCAEIGRPPGGEVDLQPAELVSSYPENGDLNVPPGREIELRFTERVVEPLRGRPVFISPRQSKEPDIDWSGDRIKITLEEPFAEDQTYIVSVSSELQDLRGNRLDSSLSIAFSTGEAIDSGRVAGLILRGNKGAAGTLVALFDPAMLVDTVPYDSLYPTYLTSTSKSGEFSFQYLPDGEYRLIGFDDKNRDERFNPAREEFAVPDRPVIVGGDLPVDSLVMSMTRYDTLSPEILTAVGTKNNLIRIRLNKPVGMELLGSHPSNLLLRPVGDSLTVYPAKGILEAEEEETSTLTAYFGPLPEDNYRAELTYSVDQPPLVLDSLNYQVQTDDTPPAVEDFRPDDKTHFVQQIEMMMIFSEPLDDSKFSGQTFVLWQGEAEPVALDREWLDPFRLKFAPSELKAGEKYRLDVTEFELVDLAGNVLGDSLTSYPFATLNDDSLGSISGKTSISLPGLETSQVVLTFDKVAEDRSFDITVDNNREFKLILPPGKYLLSGFIDEDGNEEKSDGSIFPYRPAETRAFYPDTVAVRARFETAGILFEFN